MQRRCKENFLFGCALQAASTLTGRGLDLLGYILSLYCVVKMVLCAKAALVGEDFSSDPASRALSLLLLITSRGKVHVNLQVLFLRCAVSSAVSTTHLAHACMLHACMVSCERPQAVQGSYKFDFLFL